MPPWLPSAKSVCLVTLTIALTLLADHWGTYGELTDAQSLVIQFAIMAAIVSGWLWFRSRTTHWAEGNREWLEARRPKELPLRTLRQPAARAADRRPVRSRLPFAARVRDGGSRAVWRA